CGRRRAVGVIPDRPKAPFGGASGGSPSVAVSYELSAGPWSTTIRAVSAGSEAGSVVLLRAHLLAFERTTRRSFAAKWLSFPAAPFLTKRVFASTVIVKGCDAFR